MVLPTAHVLGKAKQPSTPEQGAVVRTQHKPGNAWLLVDSMRCSLPPSLHARRRPRATSCLHSLNGLPEATCFLLVPFSRPLLSAYNGSDNRKLLPRPNEQIPTAQSRLHWTWGIRPRCHSTWHGRTYSYIIHLTDTVYTQQGADGYMKGTHPFRSGQRGPLAP